MYIHKYYHKEYQASDSESIEDICSSLINPIHHILQSKISDRSLTGIYMTTFDAGVQSSVEFWKSAIKLGPNYVFPQTFPHTLSNYPAGYLARILKVYGPNYTIVGTKNALLAALDHAISDLSRRIVNQAIICAIDFHLKTDRISKFALILTQLEKSNISLQKHSKYKETNQKNDYEPSELLSFICKALSKKDEFSFGSLEESFYCLMYEDYQY